MVFIWFVIHAWAAVSYILTIPLLRYMDQLEWLDKLPSLMDGRYPDTLLEF